MMDFLNIFTNPIAWGYLFLLSGLEIVLGIDNIIFISIVTDKVGNPAQRKKARILGLSLSLILRFVMLAMLSFLASLDKQKVISEFTWHDIVLLLGGIFLLYKSTVEMHKSVAGEEKILKKQNSSFGAIVLQIVLVDLVFSFDSVISAVGMTSGLKESIGSDPIALVYLSVIISMVVMLIFSGVISKFISENPTIKMIALSFLLMIGIMLIAESFSSFFHEKFVMPKGYIYFGFAFSLFVEMLNIRMRKNSAKKNA